MKSKEVREKSDDALKQELEQANKRLFDLRNQSVTEKVEDTSQYGKLRRDIARMKTITLQRTRQASEKPAAETTSK